MSVQSSCPNNIVTICGNELKLFVDSSTNKLTVKDSNGCIQTLDTYIVDEGITQIIAGTCLTGGGTTPTVTLNHADTSTLSGNYGQPQLQDGCYIKSICVDGLGHLVDVTTDNFNTFFLGINDCAVDSALLNNQSGSYYLDFCNFTNVPPLGDITDVCAGDGLSGGGNSGQVTLCNADKGSSQNIVKNFCGNTGGFTASTNNGLFCIVGSGSVSTSVSGCTLTISSTSSANNCCITLNAGTGLSGGGSFTLNQSTNSSVSFTNSDKGSDQNIFKNFCVSGEGTVTANNNNDTLTFIKGTDINITTDPTNQTITISSTAPTVFNCQIQITGGDGLGGSATFDLNQSTNGSFNICNTDKGSSQTFFQSIEVIGSCTVTADQNNDTLCLSAGSGITLASDNTQNLITIGTNATTCTGTVTSVGFQTNNLGTDVAVSGSPITSNGTITLSIPSASASARGVLTSTDWSTFNSKTSCVGTVTSVGLTTGETGTDVSVSGSPITSSGAITLNIPVASATNTGKLSSTDWSDFNNKVDDVTAGTGISVSGTDTIEVTNTDKGSDQDIFKNIAVSGESTIVADSNNDTLTFVGSGIAITTDDTTDTVTFTVTDAGGTVTSVGLETGTTGTDVNVSGSPITSSGNITLNIPDASASSRGVLTSTDWSTFNAKTTCTGTVTSVGATGGEGIVVTNSPITTSGSFGVSLCLNELSTSIDNQDGCFFAVVDSSNGQHKLTKSEIHLSGFDNDANFTTCTGTVSSVALSSGGGISVSGSPITGSGTITVTNTDTGSSQNIFKNVAVSGQTTIVADSNDDTLTFVEGTGITITTNAINDSITISNEGADGTVTEVCATTGTAGTDFAVTGSPITTNGTLTFNLPVASDTNTGKLSSTDWSTFNAKTTCTGTVTSVGALTGTTGTDFNISGSPITGSGDITFNLPTASATNRGALSNTDWSTFNSKTTCVGTVTSVAVDTDELGTDVSVSGSPITGNGTITISIPEASATKTGKLSSADFVTFSNKTSCVGTIFSVSGGVGLTGTVTTSGSICVNYSGVNNIICSATDCTGTQVDVNNSFILNEDSSNLVVRHKINDLPFSNCTGTVTSVGLATNETGTDVSVSGSPVTDNGDITLSIPVASATNTGKLSNTDWSTFDSKTTCVGTVTSVGIISGVGIDVSGSPITTSGDITLTNTDKGSDQCIFKTIAVSGENSIVADSNSDTLTFEGSGIAITTDDTTDTITFTVTDAGGTVTSVGLATGTTGTDVNVSNSPITSSGDITLNIPVANATNTGKLSSTDWSTFNSKLDDVSAGAGISITGTGTKTITNSSAIFKCIASTGQANIVADSLTDTLNIEASTGISISTNATTDTLTITNTNTVYDSTICINAGTGMSGGGDFSLNQSSGETITVTNSDRGSSQNIFKNVAVSGQNTIVAEQNNDTLTFVGSGITITTDSITDTVTFTNSGCQGTVTSVGLVSGGGLSVSGSPITSSGDITVTNTDKGSDQNIFKNIAVSGESTIVADSNNDTLTIVAGTGIQLSTNATTDTLTICSPDAGGTVTEVCATTGTAGTDFAVTGSPITTNGTLTFNLPVASATNTGKLSNTDWSTFNAKTTCTGTITGVTASGGLCGGGSSGSVTICADYDGTDNIVLASGLTSGNVEPEFRILASADDNVVEAYCVSELPFTNCTGTVTSVGATTGSTGTDFNITGSPVTGSGTITFNLPTASATNTGKLSSTDWSTFNSKTNCTGTVTSVGITGGVGIDASGSPITGSGTIDLTLDLNELTTSTSDAEGDFFAVVDSVGNQNKLAKANINLSGFNNNLGWTSCIGDITGVTAGTGLSGGGTSGTVTLTNSDRGSSQNIFKNVAVSGQNTIVADNNNDTLTFVGSGIDITTNSTTDTVTFTVTDAGGTVTEVCGAVGTTGTDFNVTGSPITTNGTLTFNLPVASASNTGKLSSTDWSTFNSKTTCVGTITNVVAGTGMSGGGSSGSVTLNNVDRGSLQNIFKNVAVSGQSTIVADNNNDTLTFANGSNITITTNATSDTLTVSTSATTCTGTVTGVTASGGLCGGGSSGSVTICADYSGTDNIVLASGLTSGNVEPEFRILASADDNVVEAYCVSELPFTNCVGTITGTGTINKVPKWSSSTGLGNSNITDDGNTICLSGDVIVGSSDNTASNGSAFAGGQTSSASGGQSFAFGFQNNSSGGASASFGAINTASGDNSFVANAQNTSSGYSSATFGCNSTNSGSSSFIAGGRSNGISNGAEQFIGGGFNSCISSGCGGNASTGSSNRICCGFNNFVTGGSNCVLLNCNLGSGWGHSFIMGQCNRNCGNASYSFTGGNCSVNFSAGGISFGCGATASNGIANFSFGRGTTNPNNGVTATIEGSFVVGRYNVHSTTACHHFAVGTGTADGSRCTAFNVDANSRVGIGVLAPSCQLQLSQNSAGKPTSSSWCIVSDERLKCNIRPYQKGLNEIIQVNTKVFDYNGKAKHPKDKDAVGIIAQEMINVFPETISSFKTKLNEEDEEETELLGYDSHAVTYALINAVKELNTKIETLENKIKTLESN